MIELSSETQEKNKRIIEDFRSLSSFEEISSFFGVSSQVLRKIVYSSHKYTPFSINKKNGDIRTINAPNERLKMIQKKLADTLMLIYTPTYSAHGFVQNRSIVTNASAHLNSKHVLNFDVKDFFPSIHQKRVFGVFKYFFKYNNLVSGVLTEICVSENCLPQGAPTSPILSNIICYNLDKKLRELCIKNNAMYTRYVDDITISCKKNIFPKSLAYLNSDKKCILSKNILNILEEENFFINPDKTRIQAYYQSQVVTGLKVNKKLNVDRDYILKIRAMMHNLEVNSRKDAEKKFNEFYTPKKEKHTPVLPEEVIRGMINYVSQVKGKYDPVVNKLIKQFNALKKSPHIKNISIINDDPEDINNYIYRINIDFYKNYIKKEVEEDLDEKNLKELSKIYSFVSERLIKEYRLLKRKTLSFNRILNKIIKNEKKVSNKVAADLDLNDNEFEFIDEKKFENKANLDSNFLGGFVGTAFLLKDIGLVSCAHVFMDLQKLSDEFNLYDYKITAERFDVEGNIIESKNVVLERISKELDIAICKFTEDSIFTSGFSVEQKKLSNNDLVVVAGYPNHTKGALIEAKGIVIGTSNEPLHSGLFNKRLGKMVTQVKNIQIDATIYEGNSGGPIFSENYKVIGIASKGTTSTRITGNTVIPIQYIEEFNLEKVTLTKVR